MSAHQRVNDCESEVTRLTRLLAKTSSEVDSRQTALLAAEESASVANTALSSLLDELATVEGHLTFTEIDPSQLSEVLQMVGQGLLSTPLSDLLTKLAQRSTCIEEQAALATKLLGKLEELGREKGAACSTLLLAQKRISALETEVRLRRQLVTKDAKIQASCSVSSDFMVCVLHDIPVLMI